MFKRVIFKSNRFATTNKYTKRISHNINNYNNNAKILLAQYHYISNNTNIFYPWKCYTCIFFP